MRQIILLIARHFGLRFFSALLTVSAMIWTVVLPLPAVAENIPENSIFHQNSSPPVTQEVVQQSMAQMPVYFEENHGQFNNKVRYYARGTSGYDLFLTATEAVYVLRETALDDETKRRRDGAIEDRTNRKLQIANRKSTAVYMSLAGANANAVSSGTQELAHRTNYFKGAESNWRTEIANYGQVRMSNLYAGIDTVWHGRERGGVQYDFVVQPNANPNQIAWEIEGAQSVELDAEGNLLIKTEYGDIKQNKPFSYQEENGIRQEIESRFIIEQSPIANRKSQIRFELGEYDRTKPLTIDPSVNLSNLSFSTFLGGSSTDQGFAIKVDNAGNVYVSGSTNSPEFPTTAGTIDTSPNGFSDVFVTKMNAAGTSLIYSTFIGGSATEGGDSIAIDSSGNAFITGSTSSTDYPTIAGAFDTSHNGSRDVFATKLNAAGSALIYSTFIGGSALDQGFGIAIDSSGNAFITGDTPSADYPIIVGSYDITHNGSNDVFVTKLSPTGAALSYSTFIGGSSTDVGRGIAIDSSGNAFITGYTTDSTTDYPTIPGAYNVIHNGSNDVFVTKLNPTGSILLYSTFIGGNLADQGDGIAIDSSGNAFITGFTTDGTTDYPVTAGAYNTTHNGSQDVFVTKLNAAGSALSYSTFIGGSSNEQGYSIAIDSSGNAFVTGGTLDSTTDYPATPEVVQPQHNGGSDAFVSKLGDYSISGRSVDQTGAPLANVAIQMSGLQHGFMLTDPQGYFYFGDTANSGTIWVSATSSTYNFTPNNYQINQALPGNFVLQFVGRPASSGPTSIVAPIGGTINSTAGNIPLPETTVTLVDIVNPANIRTITTDSLGKYRFDNIPVGRYYVVFAQREGFNFNPGEVGLTFLTEQLNLDFLAAPTSPRPISDFDGDGKTDLAVFRPTEGNWYILQSQTNSMQVVRFGLEGDIPLAADFDGDRRADLTIYRPTEGNWYRLNSSNGGFSALHFGTPEDKPVPADFDGDGKTDIAVFRPSTGVWHRLNSTDNSYTAIKWGISTDKPVPADFDSDGRADLTVFRDGTWYRLNSTTNQAVVSQFGTVDDKPLAADFDGDGRADTAVFRPTDGSWHWLDNLDGEYHVVRFGSANDIPTPADYNGDGRIEHGVYQGGMWSQLYANGSTKARQFGLPTDVPVIASR